MHLEARDFTNRVKEHFAGHFTGGKRVLDVGSIDINGNNRCLFDGSCTYEGIDVAPGRNVDHVCAAGDFGVDGPAGVYDTIVSTECFAHDLDFVRSLSNIVRLLKAGGLFLFTCASTGRPEHGTARVHPDCSPSSRVDVSVPTWYPNYYRTLTPEDVQRAVPVHLYFDSYMFETNRKTHDLYFWGVRNDRPCAGDAVTAEAPAQAVADMAHYPAAHDGDDGLLPHTCLWRGMLDRYRYATGVRYLEVGVGGGDGLREARDYLRNATYVVGVDANPQCKRYERPLGHIYVEIGQTSYGSLVEAMVSKYGPFDVIVDRASRTAEHTASIFEALFPLLKDGGLYVAESAACLHHPICLTRCKCGSGQGSYFHKFLPGLDHGDAPISDHRYILSTAAATDPFEMGIESILFGVSFVAVAKRVRPDRLLPGAVAPPAVRF